MANLDPNRTGHADSKRLGDDEPNDLAWAAAIAQVWAAELADSQQDIYTLEDGHPIEGGDVRPPHPRRQRTTAVGNDLV